LIEREITKIQELVYELRVRDVMKQEVIKVTSSTPMSDLRGILRDNHISGAPVAEEGKLVGIISLEDFIRWLYDGGPDCAVADRMTRKVISVFEDEPLVQAFNNFERFGFGRLPVLARGTGKLTGIITKGDIIGGLLKKLDIGYRQAEIHSSRSSHIFEDIVADKSALIFEYRVSGGDFSRGGTSAGGLKTTLLRLGIPPGITRRAAIATYEAEMNLIFFTSGGKIKAKIEPEIIQIKVEDDGPGIPDVEQALKPGFSTAPDWVRELGFGAGMGLQNIQKCSDRMRISSTVGKGTRLKVDILLEDEDGFERDHKKA